MKTIIFLSGFAVPTVLAKSRFVWDDKLWEGYNRIYYTSKTPTSDKMAQDEIHNLVELYNKYPDAYYAGHSLGAWWLANLSCFHSVNIKKMLLMTPLVNTKNYPMFNVTERFNPILKSKKILGPHKVCVLIANNDLLVKPEYHGHFLVQYFNATKYIMQGGHFYQSNHKLALEFAKVWLDL